jgi:hypothetical protein
MQPQWVAQPPTKKRWFTRPWAIILWVLLGLIFLGSLRSALAGDNPNTTAAPAPTVTKTITEEAPDPEPQPTATVTVTAKPKTEPKPTVTVTAKPKADNGPSTELGEGTYEVGKDVKAGRYKTTVPDDSLNCYWARLKDDSGSFKSIIANANANPGARVSVTIKNGEFFENTGCGDWKRQ